MTCSKSRHILNWTCSVFQHISDGEMFYTVQTQLHTTNQKLEGNVWEICVKSLLFSNWTCSVFQHIWICEMFGTVHLLLHAIKQKNFRIGKKKYNNNFVFNESSHR